MSKPKMNLIGEDGNVFAILGRAQRLLRTEGMDEQAKEMFSRVTSCHSYEEALNIVSEYVETELSAAVQKSAKRKDRCAHER